MEEVFNLQNEDTENLGKAFDAITDLMTNIIYTFSQAIINTFVDTYTHIKVKLGDEESDSYSNLDTNSNLTSDSETESSDKQDKQDKQKDEFLISEEIMFELMMMKMLGPF